MTLCWPAAFSSLTHVICIVCISVVFLRILLALQLFPNPGPRTLLLPQVTQNEQLFAAPQEEVKVNKMVERERKNDRKTPSFLMKKRQATASNSSAMILSVIMSVCEVSSNKRLTNQETACIPVTKDCCITGQVKVKLHLYCSSLEMCVSLGRRAPKFFSRRNKSTFSKQMSWTMILTGEQALTQENEAFYSNFCPPGQTELAQVYSSFLSFFIVLHSTWC